MRKITEKSIESFLNFKKFGRGNTTVTIEESASGSRIAKLILFGNKIATLYEAPLTLYITNAGWFSPTTRERLNALPNVNITQLKKKWYLDGVEWDGMTKQIEVKEKELYVH